MVRTLLAMLVVAGTVTPAAAQHPPAYSFRQVGSTSDLVTARSREHWANMGAKLKRAKDVSEVVAVPLGVPPDQPATLAGKALNAAMALKREWEGRSPLPEGIRTNMGIFGGPPPGEQRQ